VGGSLVDERPGEENTMKAIYNYLGVVGVVLIILVTPFVAAMAYTLFREGHYANCVVIILLAYIMVRSSIDQERRRKVEKQQCEEARRLIELCQVEGRPPTADEWSRIERGL
jgi:hypothetical protein